MMLLFTFLALFLEWVEIRSEDVQLAKIRNKRSQVCYGTLGCFADGFPFVPKNWLLTFLPQSPDKIRTQFLLFTRQSRVTPQELDARNFVTTRLAWTKFKVRPTKILIHGFLDTINLTTIWKGMINELLTHGDYNVIFVDWSKGNRFPYTQATANTRVVGAQVAELIKALTELFSMSVSDFHIIGHSLGAQTAGYAGERIPGLGRITGLDPAGPYFEDTDKRVRLDETDAAFVDIIYSNARPLLLLGFGTRTISGHVNFFPNGGQEQPNCPSRSLQPFIQGELSAILVETLMCNHVRSSKFFSESINSPCPFMAYPCASESNFKNNLCHSCTDKGCQRMGFHAKPMKTSTGIPVKYYLTTGGNEPYCQYHFIVTVKLSAKLGKAQRGTLDLVVNGAVFKFNKVTLTSNPQTFQPGQSYRFYQMLPHDFGDVQSVTLTWKSVTLLNILHIFSKSNQLFVDEIDIYREEAGIDARFCSEGQQVSSGGSLSVSRKC